MQRWSFENSYALVTGASRGIGRAVAASLLERGADVMLVARNNDDLNSAATELCEQFPNRQIDIHAADVSDPSVCKELVRQVNDLGRDLNILVNNVGTNIRKLAIDYSMAEYQQLMQINLASALQLAQLCHPLLVAAKSGGSIVNVSSVAGMGHLRTGVVYAMSKAAMLQMSRNLAVEWASDGIRVNSVAPWYTDTPLAQQVLQDTDYKESVLQRTPMKRIASSQEVADAVTFLCLPAASYITGICLPVDGGMTVNLF